jgi:hypothetical protein
MDLREIGFGGVDWIQKVAGSCEHGNEPLSSINAGNFLTS